LDDLTRDVADALAVLARLHRGRNRRPIADTLTQLLEATRAHAGVAIWPTGEQALGNLLRVLDLARRFEAAGAPSFRSFAMPLAGCAPVELLEKRDEVLRHDKEEAYRVTYVAATRAREMVVVPVVGDAFVGDEAASGWLDVLHPVVFPKPMDRRRSEPAVGCPPVGE